MTLETWKMSKFKGFVYGGPVPGSAGFYFGQGSGGPGICSGASPALVHVNFVNSRFYTRTSGQVGITSNNFADLLTFTGAPGREYIDANGDTVVVGLNEPRLGSYIDTGSGLFNAGIRFNSGHGEAMKFNGGALARAIGSPGPELVTNGDFATDLSGWDNLSIGSGTATWVDGTLQITRVDGSNVGWLSQGFPTVVNQTYLLRATRFSGSGAALRVSSASGGNDIYDAVLDSGVTEIFFTATSTTTWVNFRGGSNGSITRISDVGISSVTMPAAVSIAIEGYMTYADENTFSTVRHFVWEADSDNRFAYELSTAVADTGRQFFEHRALGVSDSPRTDVDDKAPGTNVPFNYASRHLAGASRGASDGVLTAATTPASMPDLIASDFEIATNFNGNITSLTIWADDITDTGIQAATTDGSGFNPLCPFDG